MLLESTVTFGLTMILGVGLTAPNLLICVTYLIKLVKGLLDLNSTLKMNMSKDMNDRDDNQAGYYSKKELNNEFENDS